MGSTRAQRGQRMVIKWSESDDVTDDSAGQNVREG